MSKTHTAMNVNGTPFLGMLALLFIGLKLGGVIEWAWLWVLSPIWIPLALGLSLIAFAAVFVVLATGHHKRSR